MTNRYISGWDKVTDIIGTFSIREFSKVKELHFIDRECYNNEFDLYIVLFSEYRKINNKINIKFYNVSNLYIKIFGGGLTQITGLYIKDISDKGWEKIRWEVGDFEIGAIKFYAADISISM